MFGENKFHNLIENENAKGKSRAWKRVSSGLLNGCNSAVSPSPNDVSVRWSPAGDANAAASRGIVKWLAPCIAVILAFVLAVFVFAYCISGDNGVMDETLYYSYTPETDYTCDYTEMTILEYAAATGADLLSFDWYGETEYYIDYLYHSADTGDVICFNEIISDPVSECMVYIWIVNENINFEPQGNYNSENHNISVFNGVTVKWIDGDPSAYFSFSYSGYNYYVSMNDLEISMYDSQLQSLYQTPINYGLSLIEQLLS